MPKNLFFKPTFLKHPCVETSSLMFICKFLKFPNFQKVLNAATVVFNELLIVFDEISC